MTARELIEIFKAFDEGKIIQCYSCLGDKWTDVPKDLHTLITWIYNGRTLRIKTKPREWYLILDKHGNIIDHCSSADAAFYITEARPELTSVHVREIIPEKEKTNERKTIKGEQQDQAAHQKD